MKRLFVLLILILPYIKAFSQGKTVVDDIAINAKIFFLNQDTYFYTYSQALTFLKDSSNFELLSSKGFNQGFIFIKIKIKGNFESTRKKVITDSMYILNKVPFSCDYIIAFKQDEKLFYRLKGFASNDFVQFFKKKYKKKDRTKFLNQFWVKELDLACLFDSHFANIKPGRFSSCMQSCKGRDKKFVQIRND